MKICLVFLSFLTTTLLFAGSNEVIRKKDIKEVSTIAESIFKLNQQLPLSKYFEYGEYIYHASQKYRIEPSVLVAIAQRESSFRNDLPEGKAGEWGICQIRKSWLKNERFRSEFKKASKKDLKNPEKSFLYAAWILNEIKGRMEKKLLPYWSHYNAKQYEPRKKYTEQVNENLVVLKEVSPQSKKREVAKVTPIIASPVRETASVEMDAQLRDGSTDRDVLGNGPQP